MSEIKNKTDYVLDLNDIDASIKAIVGVDPNQIKLSNWFGSCQYQRSELFHRLLDKVGHETLGITFTKSHKTPTIALLGDMYKEVLDDYSWCAKQYSDWVEIFEKGEEYWVENTWLKHTKPEDRENECIEALAKDERLFLEALERVENGISDWTLDDCMNFTRESSWDLWSAAPWVMGYQFEGLKFKPITSGGAGKGMPLINMLIQQDDAYDTGMATHLLHKFCGVSIDSMDGFDT
jgi:hypothetical protein